MVRALTFTITFWQILFGCVAYATDNQFSLICKYDRQYWSQDKGNYKTESGVIYFTIDVVNSRFYETISPTVTGGIVKIASISDTAYTLRDHARVYGERAGEREYIDRLTGGFKYEFVYPDLSGGRTSTGTCDKVELIPIPEPKF